MKIQVTQEHIDAGKRGTTTCCPIALAIRPMLGASYVLSEKIARYGVNGLQYFTLPANARKFVEAFDNGETVEPFTLVLEY